MTFGKHEEQVFLGRDLGHQKDYSEHTAVEIDREVRRIIEEAYQQGAQPAFRAYQGRCMRWRSSCSRRKFSTAREVARCLKAYREGREPFGGVARSQSKPTPRLDPKSAKKNPRSRGERRFPDCRPSPSGQLGASVPRARRTLKLRMRRIRYSREISQSIAHIRPPALPAARAVCATRHSVPRRHGRAQRHARFVFRWRPLPRS